MSSTNRGAVRHGADYYVTPISAVKAFLAQWKPKIKLNWAMLDPCAGGDDNNLMSYPEALKHYMGETWEKCNLHITTLDKRPDSRADIIHDYLTWEPNRKFDLIITNPPFSIALDVIKKSLELCEEGGYVVMLQRLNFMGSRERSQWFKEMMPHSIYVHSKRMRFLGTTNTDSIEYAHFIWRKGCSEEFSRLYLVTEG